MEIECSFGDIHWPAGSGTGLYCDVKSSSITKPGTKVTSYKGAHRAGKSYSDVDVEVICFNNLVVEYFPMGLNEIFPNLKKLQVNNCGLKEITRRDLTGLENLTDLNLSSNQLKSLPDDLLSGMTKLTRISFYGNKLEFVSSNLLQPIKNNKLVSVDFGATIGCFEPGTACSLGSLQELCDVIDVHCKKPRKVLVVEDFPESTVRCFKELWTSGCFSDFVIVCASKEFKVHKFVVSFQSSVLKAALQNDMQESKTGRLEIVDFSKEAVEDFLKFLYTGETPEEANAMEILELASKYDVPALLFLMGEVVLHNLDETNAIEILTMAKQHNREFLAQAAFNNIQGLFVETNLDPSLVNEPERLKQLIDAKRKYVEGLIEMKREYEGVLKSCSQIKK